MSVVLESNPIRAVRLLLAKDFEGVVVGTTQ